MKFSQTIRCQLDSMGWTIARFGKEIGRTPEHARKLRNGMAFPSDDLIPKIVIKLGLDGEKFRNMVLEDRWIHKHGKKPPTLDRHDLGSLELIWGNLCKEDKEYILCVASCLLKSRAFRAKRYR